MTRNEARDRRRAEERAELPAVCLWCGQELERAPTGRRAKFCGTSCRIGWHNAMNGQGRTTPPEYTPSGHGRCSKCWLLVRVGEAHTCTKKKAK